MYSINEQEMLEREVLKLKRPLDEVYREERGSVYDHFVICIFFCRWLIIPRIFVKAFQSQRRVLPALLVMKASHIFCY